MTRNSLTLILGALAVILSNACSMDAGPQDPTPSTQTAQEPATQTSSDTPTAPATVSTVTAPTFGPSAVLVGSLAPEATLDAGTDSGNSPDSIRFSNCIIAMSGTYTFSYTPTGAAPTKASENIVLVGGQRTDLYPQSSPTVTDVACKLQEVLGPVTSILQGTELAPGAPADNTQNTDIKGTYTSGANTWTVAAHRTALPVGM